MSDDILIIGRTYLFGIHPLRPIAETEGAKVRVRMRPNSFAEAYVRRSGKITKHHLLLDGERWRLGPIVAAKATLRAT